MRIESRPTLPTLLLLLALPAAPAAAQDSPMVRILKGGKVPEARQGTILEMIGKRGDAEDLGYVFSRAVEPEGFGPAARLQALRALADAASTRKVRPDGDLDALAGLIRPADIDEPTRLAAIRLAGLWGVEAAGPALRSLAETTDTRPAVRAAALDALVALGGERGRASIEALARPAVPWDVRSLAAAALAKLDPEAATAPALAVLADAPPGGDLGPLLAAFLGKQGGADRLAAAVSAGQLEPDAAKRALRGMYALGRTDAPLVAALSKVAGLDAEVQPFTEAQMQAMIADVQSKGDAARGEEVFRRADLNCTQCHALAGAGGGVGPELSAVGNSSPLDYLINAVLQPDQAIKEEYETLVILTADGQIIQGIVKDRAEDRLVLKEATGELRTLPTSEIEDSRPGGSLMPKGLPNLMTRDEFVDLVRFLSELGKPGPYGLKSAPTLQRWRAWRDAASQPEGTSPPPPESDAWVPAYAKYAGGLPLGPLTAISGGPVVVLLGEVEVTAPGPVAFRLDSDAGVTAAIDGEPVPVGPAFGRELSRGRHALTLRIDTARRPTGEVRVEVTKPEGSAAEVAVVGGK
jgi:putative heme-binding domain-containing protein